MFVYRPRIILFILLLISLFITIPSQASVIYVKQNGLDTNEGSSWDNAKSTIQSALQKAVLEMI
jgi:hypothetical protein